MKYIHEAGRHGAALTAQNLRQGGRGNSKLSRQFYLTDALTLHFLPHLQANSFVHVHTPQAYIKHSAY